MASPCHSETDPKLPDQKLNYELEYAELVEYTDNFSEENFLGTFQFGEVYRGKIEHSTRGTLHVMVKIWEVPEIYEYRNGDNEARLMWEFIMLRHEDLIPHPGMIELYGYCWDDEYLGAVYNFKPLDIVYNLVPKDSFTWLQRIKVAVGFARLLKFLHTGSPTLKPYLVRNVSASHIVVDEEFNPKLYDLGMITGGFLPDRTIHQCYYLLGCYGYIDMAPTSGKWTNKTDVFAFAIVLLNLVSKRIYTEEDRQSGDLRRLVQCWAQDRYKGRISDSLDTDSDYIIEETPLYSFADPSFETDPDYFPSDGRKISKLVMRCLYEFARDRPSMKKVVKHLLKLHVVKKHAEYLGLESKVHAGADG